METTEVERGYRDLLSLVTEVGLQHLLTELYSSSKKNKHLILVNYVQPFLARASFFSDKTTVFEATG